MTADMVTTFLLISSVGCEWIEITRQYQKQPEHQYPSTTVNSEEKDSYTNHTIIDYQWNEKNVHNYPGRLKTVVTNKVGINQGYQFTSSAGSEQKEVTGNAKIISHIGKVDRVQLIHIPLQPSTNKFKSKLPVSDVNVYKSSLNNDRRSSYNLFEPAQRVVKEATTQTVFDYHTSLPDTEYSKGVSNYKFQNHTAANYNPFLTENKPLGNGLHSNQFHTITELQSQNAKDILLHTEGRPTSDIPNQKPKLAAMNSTTVKKAALNNLTFIPDNKEKLKSNHKIERNKESYDKPEDISNESIEKENDAVPSTEKSKSIEVIVKFVKLVSDTISLNTGRDFTSKLRYLEELKNNLMADIETRIDETWPDNYEMEHRQIRSTEETPRGHIEFPSSETTLMSISFLTFAVFLIKLVLQVIQTYKNKTMMVAPVVVATAARAAFNALHRRDKHH